MCKGGLFSSRKGIGLWVGLILLAFAALLTAAAFFCFLELQPDPSSRKLQLAEDFLRSAQVPEDPVILRGLLKDLWVAGLSESPWNAKSLALLEFAHAIVGSAKNARQIHDLEFILSRIKAGRQSERNIFSQQFTQWKNRFERYFGFLKRPRPSVWLQKKGRGLSAEEKLLLEDALRDEQSWRLGKAIDGYRKLMTTGHDSKYYVVARFDTARAYLKSGQWEEAKDIYSQLKKDYRGTWEEAFADQMIQTIARLRKLARLREKRIGKLGAVKGAEGIQRFYFELGLMDLNLFKLDRSADSFQNVFEAEPEGPLSERSLFYAGLILKWNGLLEEASRVFESLKTQFPRSEWTVYARYQLADIIYMRHEYEIGATEFANFARNFTSSSLASLALFRSGYTFFYDLDHPVRAAEILAELKRSFVNDEIADYTASEVLPYVENAIRDTAFQRLRTSAFQQAKENFQKAIQVNERDAWARSGLGTTLLLLGDMEGALEEAKKAVEIDPDEYTLATLGFVCDLMGRYEEALDKYRKSLALRPDYLLVLYNMGRIYALRGEYNLAAEVYEKAAVIKPDAAEIHNNLGHVYWYLKRYFEAEEEFKKAITLRPDYIEGHYNLGLAYEGDRKYDLAKAEFEKALQLNPKFKEAEMALARLPEKNEAS